MKKVKEICTWFWNTPGFGSEYVFPRTISDHLVSAFPVSIIGINNLNNHHINQWLAEHNVLFSCSWPSRNLQGCLFAYEGKGLIFYNTLQNENECRMTIAHEAAHFLVHYLAPRNRAIKIMGCSICEVLDGHRAPTYQEELSSVFSKLRFGVFEHAMSRDMMGLPNTAVEKFEAEADSVAFELLAPSSMVIKEITSTKDTKKLLTDKYGLPDWAAASYADLLNSRVKRSQTWF
jgi:hypothetical protein